MQQIGFLDRRVDPGLAVHAHHAEIERSVKPGRRPSRAASWPPESARVRRTTRTSRMAPETNDAVPGEDHRPLGIVDQIQRLLHIFHCGERSGR